MALQNISLFEPVWGEQEKRAMIKALDEGQLNEGKYVREFEQKFAQFVGAKYALLVPNGSIALYMAIRSWLKGINAWLSSAKIKVPDYYGIFAANAVRLLGRHVEIIDLNSNFNTSELGLLTVPIHVNGRLSEAIDIEDCCQAIAHHTKGAISCYSFHASKLITCAGMGGAICCDDGENYYKLAALKDHGRPERILGELSGVAHPVTDNHSMIGSNFKMNDVSAAFGLEQLKKLPDRLARMGHMYRVYQDLLGLRPAKTINWIDGEPSWRVDCLVENPGKLVSMLAKDGIQAKRFYLPLHKQPQFAALDKLYPNCMTLYDHGIYLPANLTMTDEDIQRICNLIITYTSQS